MEFMHVDQRQFERFSVVAIFLLVAAFAVQDVWHEVKASEGRTLNNAASEYKTLKKMYSEQLHPLLRAWSE